MIEFKYNGWPLNIRCHREILGYRRALEGGFGFRVFFAFILVTVLLSLASCAPSYRVAPVKAGVLSGKRILIMPVDIMLYELSVGGLAETRADWTQTAENNANLALERFFSDRGEETIPFALPANDVSKAHLFGQVVKLYEVVAASIIRANYSSQALPTTKDRFEWSLGKGAIELGQTFQADYALFIYVRDSYASAGRIASQVVIAILSYGQYVPAGGRQTGMAALVDLRNGNIVWFNLLIRGNGDLRDFAGACETMNELLTGLPRS